MSSGEKPPTKYAPADANTGDDADAASRMGDMADALHDAASWGSTEATARLIREGVDVHVENRNPNRALETPLHTAARHGHPAVAELLITAGANPNAKGGSNRTPLHNAALHGQTAVVDCLIEAGADVNARSLKLWSPLHYAAFFSREAIVEKLLMSGADANAESLQQRSVLHCAAKRGPARLAALVIRHGGTLRDSDW